MKRLVALKETVRMVASLMFADPTIKKAEWMLKAKEANGVDWEAMELLVELLEPFTIYTTMIQGDSYPTLSRVWPIVMRLRFHLEQCLTPDDWERVSPAVRQVLLSLGFFSSDLVHRCEIHYWRPL